MQDEPKNDLYTSVLLEGIRSDFKAVAEVVQHLSGKVESMGERLTRVENKLDDHIVQSAIEHKLLRESLKEEIRDMREEITEEMQEMRQEFSKEIQTLHVRLHDQDRTRLH